MIQDIDPHCYDNNYDPVPPQKESILLYYEPGQVLADITESGSITFPTFGDVEQMGQDIFDSYTYLFSIDEDRFYLAENVKYENMKRFKMESLERLREAQPGYLVFAGITGAQLFRWYDSRKFCGKCGGQMKKHDKERMLFCESCMHQEYPKIMPAVIIGIVNGNRMLLSKYANSNPNRYALIAGFTEIGETVEDTVKREVMEEVGLLVKNIRFYKSQPWSFSDTILMGFYADLEGEDRIILDTEELECAQWFEREEIPVKPTQLSLTNEMIIAFKEGKV